MLKTAPAVRQAVAPPAAKTRSKPLEPQGATRKALDLMVWGGHHRDDAAKLAGIRPKSLYNAFRKPHVKGYYLAQLEVLRTSARARAFHRMEALSQQDDNKMAAVAASRAIEQIATARPGDYTGGRIVTPGIQIIINSHRDARPADGELIEINPIDAEPRDQDQDEE